jgi:hypothetical protein
MSDPELWIAEQDESLQSLLRAARRLVRSAAPRAAERVYPGWNALGFRSGYLFCVVYPYRDAVKIAFERGDELEDPEGLLQQTGKRMKFVLIRHRTDLTPVIGHLIQSAAMLDD